MQKTILIFSIAALFSCSNNQTLSGNNKSSNIEMTKYPVQPLRIGNEEEGWGADIKLSIVEKSENDTATIYKAVSTYNGKEVGLLVSVPERKEGSKGFGQGISFLSIGTPSDYLLQVLSKLYKQPLDTSVTFVKNINMTYVNLKEFAKSITGQEGQYTAANEYKLFFEGKDDDDYAELFLNINLQEKWIEIAEKDEEYRPYVLQFLRR